MVLCILLYAFTKAVQIERGDEGQLAAVNVIDY